MLRTIFKKTKNTLRTSFNIVKKIKLKLAKTMYNLRSLQRYNLSSSQKNVLILNIKSLLKI